MTPKRKGKVAAVKRAGLASLYRGIPYVFTNSWNAYVYLFTVKWVGAVGQLSGTFSIIACGNWGTGGGGSGLVVTREGGSRWLIRLGVASWCILMREG